MPNKKKNAYTYYVEERSRGTGSHYSLSFPKFAKDWDAMTVEQKDKYFKMAAADRNGGLFPHEPINQSASHLLHQVTPAPIKQAIKQAIEQATNAASPQTSVSSMPRGPRPEFGRKPASSVDASSLQSVLGPLSRLNMANIIQDVNHNVGEFLETTAEGEVPDVVAPSQEELKEMRAGFAAAVADEYPEVRTSLFDVVLVISCIPVAPADNTLTPINRPLEIAVEGFKIGAGHLEKSLFHAFVHPGRLAHGRLFAVSDARKKYHQIPAAVHVKAGDACTKFHASFKLDPDYYAVYSRLLRTAGYGGRPTLIPFLAADDVGATWACLTWLRNSANQQAEERGLPDLPPVILSTLSDFVANILREMGTETLDTLESIQNTYNQRRYHHHLDLRCPFHQDVDSELCASGTANDKVYSTFDIFRGLGFSLPVSERFVPPSTSFMGKDGRHSSFEGQ